MLLKTDRNDARGIAQLMRPGWFRRIHCKSLPAQELRAVLTGRKLLQGKLQKRLVSLAREARRLVKIRRKPDRLCPRSQRSDLKGPILAPSGREKADASLYQSRRNGIGVNDPVDGHGAIGGVTARAFPDLTGITRASETGAICDL
jgi:hypothetical protein